MKQHLLRARLKLKRELVKAVGYKPGDSVSLNRHEKPNSVSYEVIRQYAESESLEIYDPRSGLMKGHYFEARNAYLVQDVIFEPRLGLLFTKEGFLIEESTNWPIYQFYNSFPWNPKTEL